jgi:hypothetical protein
MNSRGLSFFHVKNCFEVVSIDGARNYRQVFFVHKAKVEAEKHFVLTLINNIESRRFYSNK